MTNNFRLPISYLKKLSKLDSHIIDDLQLCRTDHDNDPDNPTIYETLFDNSNNRLSNKSINLWADNFTNDVEFLKNTQSLLTKKFTKVDDTFQEIATFWDNMSSEQSFFIDKYQYIDWNWFEFLNNSVIFLQILSTYNLTSPILTLSMPIFMLLMPFIIIKMKGKDITFIDYYNLLALAFSQHQIGQLFSIGSASWDQRIYILISGVFYILQVYQNINSCYTFFTNLSVIHGNLFLVRNFISQALGYMEEFHKKTRKLKKYNPFREDIKKNMDILKEYSDCLYQVSSYEISIKNLYNLGNVMYCYYRLYKSPEIQSSMSFAIHFMGYYDNLETLRSKLSQKTISLCSFTTKNCSFKDSFSPSIIHTKPISNSYSLDKQLLITGPNAAGKTTLLKSTLVNLLLSQQLGLGFYSSAKVHPYDYIHCYINIPDTSHRDSLFQAEARRCKDIIDIINNKPNFRHFCIFDELYSGTNPYEAVASATAFLKYLNTFPNVSYVITTHFLHLCERLDKDDRTLNCHMETNGKNKDITYTYRLCNGISQIKGGTKVLHDLDYPSQILSCAEEIINAAK